MDVEQLTKQVEWLDEEHRKDNLKIKELEERIVSLEGKLDATDKKNKELDSEVTRLRTTLARVDDVEDELASFRVERGRKDQEVEKDVKGWIGDAKEVLHSQIQGLESRVETLRDDLAKMDELERQMSARIEEEKVINNTIGEIQRDIGDIQREAEEQKRQFRLAKEERQQELKRVTDLQGEVTALRKRLDEQRGRLDVNKADLQKLTTRVEDLERIRRELRKEQDEFIEQQTLIATDREKKWKNWQTQFAEIEKRADEVAEQIKTLDTTHRDVKRMKGTIENLAEQVERRINEITEMQRLAEERFRQEWTTFKADDQKRWTNYTLTQNEYRSEIERQSRDLGERLTILEDATQEMQDQIRQLSGQSEKQLQAMLSLIREWVSNYEEIMDSIR
ncbi:MAG: hypothetical protein R6U57_14035 [Anaerolineales bacterium]